MLGSCFSTLLSQFEFYYYYYYYYFFAYSPVHLLTSSHKQDQNSDHSSNAGQVERPEAKPTGKEILMLQTERNIFRGYRISGGAQLVTGQMTLSPYTPLSIIPMPETSHPPPAEKGKILPGAVELSQFKIYDRPPRECLCVPPPNHRGQHLQSSSDQSVV